MIVGMLTLLTFERLLMQPKEFNEGELISINQEHDFDQKDQGFPEDVMPVKKKSHIIGAIGDSSQ